MIVCECETEKRDEERLVHRGSGIKLPNILHTHRLSWAALILKQTKREKGKKKRIY